MLGRRLNPLLELMRLPSYHILYPAIKWWTDPVMIQNSPGFNGVLYQLSYQSMARAAGNDPALGDLEFPF